jgi:hypothetical protein
MPAACTEATLNRKIMVAAILDLIIVSMANHSRLIFLC